MCEEFFVTSAHQRYVFQLLCKYNNTVTTNETRNCTTYSRLSCGWLDRLRVMFAISGGRASKHFDNMETALSFFTTWLVLSCLTAACQAYFRRTISFIGKPCPLLFQAIPRWPPQHPSASSVHIPSQSYYTCKIKHDAALPDSTVLFPRTQLVVVCFVGARAILASLGSNEGRLLRRMCFNSDGGAFTSVNLWSHIIHQ